MHSEVSLVLSILLQSSYSCAPCQRAVGNGFPFCRFHRHCVGCRQVYGRHSHVEMGTVAVAELVFPAAVTGRKELWPSLV